MKILVTGTAGFIGFHTADRLLKDGHEVIGLDNINDYYDVQLKYARLRELGIDQEEVSYGALVQSKTIPTHRFIQLDISDKMGLDQLFEAVKPDRVIHLAAQAGVRYSLVNPDVYVQSNIVGFSYLLECIRHHDVGHFVFASSSSVYGLNEKQPFSTSDNVDHPISLYAASKKSNELMAHSYSHLFGIPTTGLRFFTVYGPWGRPDMALFLFTQSITDGNPIKVFNEGNMRRDFTYIDDIVEGIVRVVANPPAGDADWSGEKPDPASSNAPYRVYNIGNGEPVALMDFIEAIEEAVGKKAIKNLLPIQPGDVPVTFADVTGLSRDFDYRPSVSVKEGVRSFIKWYNEYHNIDEQVAARGAMGNV